MKTAELRQATAGSEKAERLMLPAQLPRERVIGLPVYVGTMATVAQEIMRLARAGAGGHVCVANVHMLVEARRDDALREVMESAALVVSDGMPLVRRLRRRGFRGAQQVRGPDLMKELCRRAAEEKLSVYFYGGNDAAHDEASRHPWSKACLSSLQKHRLHRRACHSNRPWITRPLRKSATSALGSCSWALAAQSRSSGCGPTPPTSTPCCLGLGKPLPLLRGSCRRHPVDASVVPGMAIPLMARATTPRAALSRVQQPVPGIPDPRVLDWA